MSKRASALFLALVLALSACVYGVFTWLKEGYHCDEIYSYGLSNTTFHYNMFEEDGSIRWNTAEDMDEYMTVPEGDEFNYKKVFENQETDVHPPLFYIFLHTFSSFTPGEYSMYPPIILNILFALGTGFILYLIAMRVFKQSSFALLSVVAYAFSVTAISMTVFIRMYAMLTFFTVAIAYMHIRIMENEYRMSWKEAIALAAVTFLGSFTQYYFFLLLLPLAGFAFVDMLIRKKYKECLKYVGVMLLTALVYIIIWSPVFKHLISSDRGTEAFGNLASSSFFENMWQFLYVFRCSIGDVFSILIVAGFVIFIAFAIIKRKAAFSELKDGKPFILIAFSVVIYLLIIFKIAPYQTDRYIAMVLPFVGIAIIVAFRFLLRIFFKGNILEGKKATAIMVPVVIAGALWSLISYYCFSDFDRWEASYIYHFTEKYESVLEEHKGKKCVLVGSHEAHLLWCLRDYEYYDGVAYVDVNDMELLADEEHLLEEDEFMLYVNNDVPDHEIIVERVKEITGFENHELVLEYNLRNISEVYRLYKN